MAIRKTGGPEGIPSMPEGEPQKVSNELANNIGKVSKAKKVVATLIGDVQKLRGKVSANFPSIKNVKQVAKDHLLG